MSLLFDSQSSVKTSYTIKKDPEQGGRDTALLSKDIWTSIFRDANIRRVCLSIRPLSKVSRRSNTLGSTLTCWAVLDDEIDSLAIPPDWHQTYGDIFSLDSSSEALSKPLSLSVVPTEPVLLTEVYVTALSIDAYQVARGRSSVLETWLSDESQILRLGALCTFTSKQLPFNGHSGTSLDSARVFKYRIDLTEPVLQGFSQKGKTRFIVTLSDLSDEDTVEDPVIEGTTEDDQEGIEINETFLATRTFTRFANQNSRHPDRRSTSNDDNLCSQLCFQVYPLLDPGKVADDHCTLYLRTVDLGRVGILSGDWAMAKLHDHSIGRLVRIVANDVLVDNIGTAAGSPMLLYNLCAGSLEKLSATKLFVSLCPSPFGARQPTIPVARTVTVARVASPVSTNKSYQPIFLYSLKNYFNSTKRLVQQGDMIVVSVDTDAACFHEGNDEFDDKKNRFPGYPGRANEVVFFRVTNVDYDVLRNDLNPNMYDGSTVGELGCWIDCAITRLIQTGVEHSRIPDIGTYLELDSMSPRAFYNTLIRRSSSQILGPGSPFANLMALSSAALTQNGISYQLDLSVLLRGARGSGKFTTAAWVSQCLGMHLFEINCYDIVAENDVRAEGTLRARFDIAKSCSPCVLILRYIEAFAQTTQALETSKEPSLVNVFHECIQDMKKGWETTGHPILVFATTSEPNHVPMSVLSNFKHEISFEAPNEAERHEILQCLLADTILASDVSLYSIATQTAALMASDLLDLISRAKHASINRVVKTIGQRIINISQTGIALTAADFDNALGKARASFSESIGAPKIPSVSWDDVGGLAHVKADILDTVQLPLEHPELFSVGLKKRSGILLYGPPGTGKTLVAKAVATSCSLNFFSVKGPELLNMYIGESEANVRRVFQRARDAKPCVIFFDELDSVAPKRGNHGDSGGVMDRIVSQLLAELDGMSSSKGSTDVFVIGATNRPDLLDPALLRPGRFDRMLYLGVSGTHADQRNILEALTRKFRLDPSLDLNNIAERCPFNYTGADFYALCSDAMLHAMSRKAKALEVKIAHLNKLPGPYSHPYPITPQYFLAEMASKEDTDVLVSQEDFELALEALVPSVSQSEMEHYARIQRRFSRDALPK